MNGALKLGQDTFEQSLSVRVMVYYHDDPAALPPFPETREECARSGTGYLDWFGMGSLDGRGEIARAWVIKDTPWLALHRLRVVGAVGESRIKTLVRTIAPFWYSLHFNREALPSLTKSAET